MPAIATLVSRAAAIRTTTLSFRKTTNAALSRTLSLTSSASSDSLSTLSTTPAVTTPPPLPRRPTPAATKTKLNPAANLVAAWATCLSTLTATYAATHSAFWNVGYDVRYLLTHFILGTERFFALTMVAANFIAIGANAFLARLDGSHLPLNRAFGLNPAPTNPDGFFFAQDKWARVLVVSGRPYAFGVIRHEDDVLADLVPAGSIADLRSVAIDFTRELVYFYGLFLRAILHMLALFVARRVLDIYNAATAALDDARAAAPGLLFDAQHAVRRDVRLTTAYLSGSPVPYHPMPASLAALFVAPEPKPHCFPPLGHAYGYTERHYLADVAERLREWRSYPRLNVIQRAKERKAGWERYLRKRLDRDFDPALIPGLGVRAIPLPDGPGVLCPRPIDELWAAHSRQCSEDLRRAIWDLRREAALRDIYPPADAWQAMYEEEVRERHAGIGRSVPAWEF